MLTWVVGAGGLLGSAVVRASEQGFIGTTVPWGDPAAATTVLESDLARFMSEAGDGEWSLVWAAGSAFVGSTRTELQADTYILERFLAQLRRQHPDGNGAVFLASSAGGVYAGSSNPPFDEATVPRPVSAYGETKLAEEELATRLLGNAIPLVVGRLSNLYGPGQNLAKPQGLISHLCRAAVTHRALNLFVPMETMRDYLFIDDAAVMITSLMTRAIERQEDTPVVRNLASERPTPVSGVVRIVEQIARRRVRVALGTAPGASGQVRDLRITTRFPDVTRSTKITPLPAGIKRVYESALRSLREHPDTLG